MPLGVEVPDLAELARIIHGITADRHTVACGFADGGDGPASVEAAVGQEAQHAGAHDVGYVEAVVGIDRQPTEAELIAEGIARGDAARLDLPCRNNRAATHGGGSAVDAQALWVVEGAGRAEAWPRRPEPARQPRPQ